VKLSPLAIAARDFFAEDLLAIGFFQRSKLQIKILLKGRDASVADLHLDRWISQKSSQNALLLQDEDVRGLGINFSVSSRVPPTRVQALARFATMAKASAINRMPDHRRLATLIAFILNLEAIAHDDALDLLDILITEIFADATRAGEKARLRTRIGGMKFTAYEAAGIAPLEIHSPLMNWVYNLLGQRNLFDLLGVVEIAWGLGIALRYVAPLVSGIASLLSAGMIVRKFAEIFSNRSWKVPSSAGSPR
jgi:uncharacterized protein DUF417